MWLRRLPSRVGTGGGEATGVALDVRREGGWVFTRASGWNGRGAKPRIIRATDRERVHNLVQQIDPSAWQLRCSHWSLSSAQMTLITAISEMVHRYYACHQHHVNADRVNFVFELGALLQHPIRHYDRLGDLHQLLILVLALQLHSAERLGLG